MNTSVASLVHDHVGPDDITLNDLVAPYPLTYSKNSFRVGFTYLRWHAAYAMFMHLVTFADENGHDTFSREDAARFADLVRPLVTTEYSGWRTRIALLPGSNYRIECDVILGNFDLSPLGIFRLYAVILELLSHVL